MSDADRADRNADQNAHDHTTGSPDMTTVPDRPLHDPLPYGTGTTPVPRRERPGSPVLAVAGLLSLGVAVWAILGAPMLTSPVVVSAALVLLVLVGLAMVVRR